MICCSSTYQANKYTKELDDICVSDRVETSNQSIEDSNTGGDYHGDCLGQVQNDCETCSCNFNDNFY